MTVELAQKSVRGGECPYDSCSPARRSAVDQVAMIEKE